MDPRTPEPTPARTPESGDSAPTESPDAVTAARRAPPGESDQEWARRLHDHTHEVELIISGAVLFALLQAPGALDGWWDGVSIRLVGTAWTVAFGAWYYTKLIVYALILSFGLHLVARAYWVGLVGLDSVFPDGVDWERLSYGPWTQEVYREEIRPLASMARSVERFASGIFSLAFLVVLIFLVSIAASTAVGAAVLAVTAVQPGWDPAPLWFAGMCLLGALPIIAVAADRWRGERMERDSPGARAIRGVLRAFYRTTAGPLFLPIQFVLFSRVAKKVIWPLYLGFLVILTGLSIGGGVVRSGSLVVQSEPLLPSRPGTRSVDARYFADTRDPGSTAPFIQGEVVTGPYVRLELPLVARREQERLERRCADEPPLGERGLIRSSIRDAPPDPAAADAVLACFGALFTVTLDGEPSDPAWDFRFEPGLGVTALVAYLPTAALEPGAHVLAIEDADSGGPGEDDDERPRRHFIRFRM